MKAAPCSAFSLSILFIGAAATKMAQALARQAEHLIHLEDDWCVNSLDPGWVETAASVLSQCPK